MFTEQERDALGRLEHSLRRKRLERGAMPAPSGRPTLLLPSDSLHVPPDPPTVKDLDGPLVQD